MEAEGGAAWICTSPRRQFVSRGGRMDFATTGIETRARHAAAGADPMRRARHTGLLRGLGGAASRPGTARLQVSMGWPSELDDGWHNLGWVVVTGAYGGSTPAVPCMGAHLHTSTEIPTCAIQANPSVPIRLPLLAGPAQRLIPMRDRWVAGWGRQGRSSICLGKIIAKNEWLAATLVISPLTRRRQ